MYDGTHEDVRGCELPPIALNFRLLSDDDAIGWGPAPDVDCRGPILKLRVCSSSWRTESAVVLLGTAKNWTAVLMRGVGVFAQWGLDVSKRQLKGQVTHQVIAK